MATGTIEGFYDDDGRTRHFIFKPAPDSPEIEFDAVLVAWDDQTKTATWSAPSGLTFSLTINEAHEFHRPSFRS